MAPCAPARTALYVKEVLCMPFNIMRSLTSGRCSMHLSCLGLHNMRGSLMRMQTDVSRCRPTLLPWTACVQAKACACSAGIRLWYHAPSRPTIQSTASSTMEFWTVIVTDNNHHEEQCCHSASTGSSNPIESLQTCTCSSGLRHGGCLHPSCCPNQVCPDPPRSPT